MYLKAVTQDNVLHSQVLIWHLHVLNITLQCILFISIYFVLFLFLLILFLSFVSVHWYSCIWLAGGEFSYFQVRKGIHFSSPQHQDSGVMGLAPEEAMHEKNRNETCQIDVRSCNKLMGSTGHVVQ